MISATIHDRSVRATGVIALLAAVALFAGACDSPDPVGTAGPELAGPAHAEAATAKDVLIGFHAAPGADQVALVESFGGSVNIQYKYIPVFAATIPADQEAALAASDGVAYVEADGTLEPLGGKQITDWGVSKIEAPAAWSAGHTGKGVKVGIFDSGIDLDHNDLRVVGGVDLVGDGHGLDDCQGHGTHVAGIVAARANGHHTVGVAPNVELYSMRFADCDWAGATISKEIAGIEWAIDNGMDVVNMSFGATVPIPSLAEEAVMDAAFARGVVLVAASGNSSIPSVGLPAGYAAVIAVGATDDRDQLATFSQWGTEQELTAPGVNNLASYLVGLGEETSFTVDSDDGREVEAVAMEFAGKTSRKGITTQAIYAGTGTPVDYLSQDCTGRIAVVIRGVGTFAQLAENGMNAGCAAVVIHNNQPGSFNGTLAEETTSDGRPWIPVLSTTLDEGLYLKEQIEAGTTIATLINDDGNLAVLSGTSMASPHAAGVAALIRGANPGLSAADVRRILQESSDDLGVAGWDPVFGHGRVNARRAVQTP